MNVVCHVMEQSYRLADVQGEINSVAERAADDYLKQQLDNCACPSRCH
jgi:hypothetical protein